MKTYKLQFIVGSLFAVGLLLGSIMTTTAQTAVKATPTPVASNTVLPTETPRPSPTMTATPTPQGNLLVLQIAEGGDDVNESSSILDSSANNLWAGNGGAISDQYLGLRFTNVAIPPGSIINAAHLEVYADTDQWITLSYFISAEAADNSEPFTADNPPSKRQLTIALVDHESNVQWLAKTMYPLDEIGAVVQEVISRPGWQMGNSLSLIAVGTEAGGEFGRKFFTAVESDPKLAVRLVIDLSPGKLPATLIPPTTTVTPLPSLATATVDACSTVSLPSRLKIGQAGQVVFNTSAPSIPVNVRKEPSIDAPRIGRLAQGVSFMVIDGPTCTEDVVWLKVQYGDNKAEGWLAEGQNGVYFVEPSN